MGVSSRDKQKRKQQQNKFNIREFNASGCEPKRKIKKMLISPWAKKSDMIN